MARTSTGLLLRLSTWLPAALTSTSPSSQLSCSILGHPNTNSTANGILNVSALGYIPETPWNDSCARTGASGCNSLPSNSPLLNIVGGGGGQSNCVDEGRLLGFPTPTRNFHQPVSLGSWLGKASPISLLATGSGLNVGNDLTRDVPDISLFAADGAVSNSFYIVCESDQTGSVQRGAVHQLCRRRRDFLCRLQRLPALWRWSIRTWLEPPVAPRAGAGKC